MGEELMPDRPTERQGKKGREGKRGKKDNGASRHLTIIKLCANSIKQTERSLCADGQMRKINAHLHYALHKL